MVDPLSADVARSDVRALAAPVLRRWRVTVLAVVVGLAVAGLAFLAQSPLYRSSASVLVLPTGVPDRAGALGARVNLDTEVQLLKSEQVASAAAALLRTPAPGAELVERLDVFVPPNAGILEIGFTASSPVEAQQGAHAFAQAYIENRSADARTAVASQLDSFTQELASLQSALEAAAAKLAELPAGSAERAYAEAQRTVLINQISQLESRVAPLRAADTVGGEIITDARAPRRPIAPRPVLFLASGLLVGLTAGVAAAYLRDRLDRRIVKPEDVARRGIPVLADLSGPNRSGLPTLPTGPVDHPVLALRNSILAAHRGGALLVVAPVREGAGATAVATHLARALARCDFTVSLVLTDDKTGLIAEAGLAERPGLADVLRGDVEVDGTLVDTALDRVLICPPGAGLDEHADQFQSDRMREVLEHLRRRADYVIVVPPDREPGVEALSLALGADSALFVLNRGTDARLLTRAVARFREVGVTVQGVVLAPAAPRPLPGSATSTGRGSSLAQLRALVQVGDLRSVPPSTRWQPLHLRRGRGSGQPRPWTLPGKRPRTSLTSAESD